MNKRLGDVLDRQFSLEDNDVKLATHKYPTTNLTLVKKEHKYKSLNFHLQNSVSLRLFTYTICLVLELALYDQNEMWFVYN